MFDLGCFDQSGYDIYSNLEELLLKAANGENYSRELDEVAEFYGNDFDKSELITQLQFEITIWLFNTSNAAIVHRQINSTLMFIFRVLSISIIST